MNQYNTTILFIIIAFIQNANIAEPLSIDSKHWMHHPQIIEIRKIYQRIEKEVSSNQLQIKKNDTPVLPDGPFQRTAYFKDKLIVKYIQEFGTEDSYFKFSHYYDKQSSLRFVFITWNTVSGGAAEYRVYFDNQGNSIYTDRRVLVEKWSFDTGFKNESFCFNPKADFEKQ